MSFVLKGCQRASVRLRSPLWLDTFIFYNKMNGTLDELHQTWMGEDMKPLPGF
jgi:hypothetical protein